MADIRTIVKQLIPTKLFKTIEPYGHLAESVVANVRYGFPARNMHVIGVTGTNGKTTTSFLIHKMLHEAGFKVGILSTVGYGIGDDIKDQTQHITTEKAGILQKRLRDFKRAGVEWVVLESSSHSLAQHRTWGVPYEIAVMTNVTHEHLDYHGSFDNYLEAKRLLFRIAAKNGRKFGVVNADDPNAQKFVDSTPRSVTYGIGAGELKASKVKLAVDYSTFRATVGKDKYDIRINISGEFNVSNSLAAVAVGRELGLSKAQIEQGIAALDGVEGRMMAIEEGQKFKVIVDFACTPDAFERVFSGLRPTTKGKIIALFGSPGHRDEAKRPIQGEIAGRYADEVVVTEDDERDVDGNQIMAEIAAGSKKAGLVQDKNLFLIHNREEAIGFALTRASQPDDVVIMLGKGHEKTIERADGSHPWSDIEVTKTALQELLKK
ncbi:UDP-N-acetylmuramoyl-L-alanyl-D-glutamate--2,6-diaminopimelate ligase [Candidatus Saccharibacteria bacterium]|nr:UDP-N-acetylmuramoyl-L-alanyl-D-glutamate--2,6-diaminopimelate ligase [Candidatus Saccharibacteria bacterium]